MTLKFMPDPNSSCGGVTITIDRLGVQTRTYFSAPSKSIDHVDKQYLIDRGLWNIDDKYFLYVQDRYREYMSRSGNNNSLNKQIKLLQAVKFLLECPQDIIDSLDPDDKAKLCAKIKESLRKEGGKGE